MYLQIIQFQLLPETTVAVVIISKKNFPTKSEPSKEDRPNMSPNCSLIIS